MSTENKVLQIDKKENAEKNRMHFREMLENT